MDAATIIDTLKTLVPGGQYEAGASIDFPTIYVLPEHLVATCRALRDEPSLRFEAFIEATAVDYLPRVPRPIRAFHCRHESHNFLARSTAHA